MQVRKYASRKKSILLGSEHDLIIHNNIKMEEWEEKKNSCELLLEKKKRKGNMVDLNPELL